MGGKFNINIQQVAGSGGQVAGTDKKVAVLDPDNIEVEFEDDDEAQEEA